MKNNEADMYVSTKGSAWYPTKRENKTSCRNILSHFYKNQNVWGKCTCICMLSLYIYIDNSLTK